MSKKPIPTICVQPDSQTALNTRRQSSDGRFTIIDEQSKDSDSFDETSSDNDSMDQFMFSKSKPFKHSFYDQIQMFKLGSKITDF